MFMRKIRIIYRRANVQSILRKQGYTKSNLLIKQSALKAFYAKAASLQRRVAKSRDRV